MGLISAALGAGSNVLSNQWKEYFYCDAIPNDTLIVAGKHKVTGRSSNTKGEENVITNGSKIVVADGQCMIIVEQGKIVEVCAEPGEFTFDTTKARPGNSEQLEAVCRELHLWRNDGRNTEDLLC